MTDVERMRMIKRSKPFGAADAILIAVVALAAVGLAVWSAFFRETGARVEIVENGAVTYYDLGADRVIELDTLRVVISGGRVHVENPTCPDKVCERTGEIFRINESIVCLPAGVVVRVVGEGGYDLSTGQER